MEPFTVKINPTILPYINNFRLVFNTNFKDFHNEREYPYAEYNYYKEKIQLYGAKNVACKPITDKEFIKFYNEKMGINQSKSYELW